MLRVPFLTGASDMEQLTKMFQALGTPTEEDWPVRYLPTLCIFVLRSTGNGQNHTKLPGYLKFDKIPKQPLRLIFSAASVEAIDWLSKLLTFDPIKRITARQVRFSFLL